MPACEEGGWHEGASVRRVGNTADDRVARVISRPDGSIVTLYQTHEGGGDMRSTIASFDAKGYELASITPSGTMLIRDIVPHPSGELTAVESRTIKGDSSAGVQRVDLRDQSLRGRLEARSCLGAAGDASPLKTAHITLRSDWDGAAVWSADWDHDGAVIFGGLYDAKDPLFSYGLLGRWAAGGGSR